MRSLDLADGLRLLHQASRGEYFGHEGHLRFGWALLEECGNAEEAERVACLTIRHVTELGGTPTKYHATMTIFWIRMLDHYRSASPEAFDVEELIRIHPGLADPELPRRHWSNLDSDEARTSWVEPDLIPIP